MSDQRNAEEAAERREQLAVQAYDSLCEEWHQAAAVNPLQEIPTPAHHHPKEQLIFLVMDDLSSQDGEGLLAGIVQALQESEKGKGILDQMAHNHARYHCAARVTEMLEHDDPWD